MTKVYSFPTKPLNELMQKGSEGSCMPQITLRAARLQRFLSWEQVEEMTGISLERLKELEIDASSVTLEEAYRLANAYEWHLNSIHWASEASFERCQLDALRPIAEEIGKDRCVNCSSEIKVQGLFDYTSHEHSFLIVCESCGNVETMSMDQM